MVVFRLQMEKFVEHWQILKEYTVPLIANHSIRGALWWFIDRNSVIFCFRSSIFPWKPETKKTVTVNFTVDNTFLTRI
jgi:hypothetical protein